MSANRGGRPPAWFVAGVAVLLAVRVFHLGPAIDEPHAWRQMDTAQYVRGFVDGGIDLLRPSVCWMGAHRVVVLECPWPEALAALAQRYADPADLRPARLVFLGLFLIALAAFHRVARALAGVDAARLAVIRFEALSLPLESALSRYPRRVIALPGGPEMLLYELHPGALL